MKFFSSLLSISAACLLLPSCISQVISAVGPKPAYTGPSLPAAIPANQTGSAKWLQRDPYELPASSDLSKAVIKYGANGIPFGIESPYRNCVHSPYDPFPRLDTAGIPSGQTAYDPYNRKPFIVP